MGLSLTTWEKKTTLLSAGLNFGGKAVKRGCAGAILVALSHSVIDGVEGDNFQTTWKIKTIS